MRALTVALAPLVLVSWFVSSEVMTLGAQTPPTSSNPESQQGPEGALRVGGIVTQQSAPLPVFVNLSRFSNDYRVGPGDLLAIEIVGHPDLGDSLRVTNSGEVSHSLMGAINVDEMTTFEIEEAIAKRLHEKGLIKQAEVIVSVREYQAKPVYVSGAVVAPGEFVMSQDLTVSDAVLLAGGLQFNAADEAVLHRRVSPEGAELSATDIADSPSLERPGVETLKIDLRPLKEGRFLDAAVLLKRGDVLVVPQMRMEPFYVVGEVVEPRNYFIPGGKTLMASQAISFAGGPLPTARMSQGMLVRYDAAGQRTEIKVDYAAILRGKQPDLPIQPNDIIFVPGSVIKSIGVGLMQLSGSMVMNTSFRIARTYQLPDAPENTNRRPEQ